MAELRTSSRDQSPRDVAEYMDEVAIGLVKLKTALAAMSLPVESATEVFLIRSLIKRIQLERTSAAKDQPTSSIEDGIAEMLAGFRRATAELESGQALATARVGG